MIQQHTFDSEFPKIKNENSVIKKPKPITNNSNKNIDDDELKGVAVKLMNEISKDTNKWIYFLSALSKFKGFSPNNVLLILSQNPNADKLLTKAEYGHLGVTVNDEAKPIRLSQRGKVLNGKVSFVYENFYDIKDTDRPNLFQDEIRILDPSFIVLALEKKLHPVKIFLSENISYNKALKYFPDDRVIYCHSLRKLPWETLAKALIREYSTITLQAFFPQDTPTSRYEYLSEAVSFILCNEYGIECDFSDFRFQVPKDLSAQEVITELGKAKEIMSMQRKIISNYSKQVHRQKGKENEK